MFTFTNTHATIYGENGNETEPLDQPIEASANGNPFISPIFSCSKNINKSYTMNFVIIQKRGCPHSQQAMKSATQLRKMGLIRAVTSYYKDTVTGKKSLLRYKKRIPKTHKTYPIILANTHVGGTYRFVGGNVEFQKWILRHFGL